MEKFGYTTSGPRKNNEDFYAFEHIGDADIFCVADGVGGSSCGEFASKFSVNQFIEDIKSSKSPNLKLVLQKVHEKLVIESFNRKECKGMATTFTAAFIQNNKAQLVHTGDSRLYLLRGNGLKQLTEDHTEVRRLLKEGLLTREASQNYSRRNVLDSAVGIDKELMITYLSFDCNLRDRIIIATDGFHGVFSKVELRDLSLVNRDFDNLCNVLVNQLEKKILTDNATFILIEI